MEFLALDGKIPLIGQWNFIIHLYPVWMCFQLITLTNYQKFILLTQHKLPSLCLLSSFHNPENYCIFWLCTRITNHMRMSFYAERNVHLDFFFKFFFFPFPVKSSSLKGLILIKLNNKMLGGPLKKKGIVTIGLIWTIRL